MKRKVSFINKDYRSDFVITMNNYTISFEDGKQTSSILRSDFTRQIYEVPAKNVGYTKYTLNNTEFMSVNDNVFKQWTFAKNTEFYSCLYCLRNKKVKEAYYAEAEKESPIPTLTESFDKFPKLPSVYLLVMQAIDIITFDAFLCMSNSELETNRVSLDYIKVDEMAKKNIPIGTGIYSDKSYYLNDELYIRLIGESIYQSEKCWIVEYSSEPSDIYVKSEKTNTALNSKSLYTGKVFVSKVTGDILYGELDEDVVSMGKNKKYSKRFVVIERKEGDKL